MIITKQIGGKGQASQHFSVELLDQSRTLKEWINLMGNNDIWNTSHAANNSGREIKSSNSRGLG